MLIENGEILYGSVAKPIVGSVQGGLVHVVFREKGQKRPAHSSTAFK